MVFKYNTEYKFDSEKEYRDMEKSMPRLRHKPVKYLRKEGNKYIYKDVKSPEAQVNKLTGAYKEAVKKANYYLDMSDKLMDKSDELEERGATAELSGKNELAKKLYKKSKQNYDLSLEADRLYQKLEILSSTLENKIQILGDRMHDKAHEADPASAEGRKYINLEEKLYSALDYEIETN